MIVNNEVEKFDVINNEQVLVYIKKDALDSERHEKLKEKSLEKAVQKDRIISLTSPIPRNSR
jgi:GTPase involved in cell partitioning and DNA repair